MINNMVILKGLVLGVILLVLFGAISSFFATFTSFNQPSQIDTVLFIFNYLTILIIGIYTAKKVEINGWLNGGITGLIFSLLIIIIGAFSQDLNFVNIFLYAGSGLLLGMLGGVIGINLKS